MKLNGENNTIKGHVFDPNIHDSLPTFVLRMSADKQVHWAERETQRYRIVEHCKMCKRPLIAEEIQAHKLNHIPYTLRPLARMLLNFPPKTLAELFKLVKEVNNG
jgi:hypothetical protein